MQASSLRAHLPRLSDGVVRCRGCLGALDLNAEAGLCERCWEGLLPLPEPHCPRCALGHDEDEPCPEPVAWTRGHALWNYHGGRPALGALLVPAIKDGELGWKAALLRRVSHSRLPEWAQEADIITCAPTTLSRRWQRGFDLAEETSQLLGQRLALPFAPTLKKRLFMGRQMERTESERRRLPRKAIILRSNAPISGRIVLLVDDVWTTGTTLLRCAQALTNGGAAEIRVLTLFRSL